MKFSAKMLGEMLTSAIDDHGFRVPIRMAAVAGNGSTIVGVYEPAADGEGLDFRLITEKVIDEIFELPINIMFADKKGTALHVKLAKDQKKPKLHVVH
jgi:hypothetical protein